MTGKKIMVVDDEAEILEVVTFLLETSGYEVVAYDRADNLIDKVKTHLPNVILLDIQLGEHDGRILCKGIKELKEYTHLPILLFSANKHYKKNIHEFLCDEFIEKPFDIHYLINRIEFYSQKQWAEN